jgi:hypothetical protein
LSAVQNMSPALSIGPVNSQVGIDDSGAALFAWPGGDGFVKVRARSATGDLTPAQNVGDGGDQQIAVNPSGAAAVVWVRPEQPLPGDQYFRIGASFGP